jgi:hypothetical protein
LNERRGEQSAGGGSLEKVKTKAAIRFHGFVVIFGVLLEDLLGTSGKILEFFFSFVHPHFL